jgi:hypothetical protein
MLVVDGSALPTALAVDEREWSVTPSHIRLRHGKLRFHVYNRGQDAHDLVVKNSHGKLVLRVKLKSGADAVVSKKLGKGRYRLYCSLFAGTPASHYKRGMRSWIRVL